MKRAVQSFYKDERGVVAIIIAALLAVFMIYSVRAIDASQMLLVRTQLQNAADAGALYGALEMGTSGDTTQAINAAILAAGANDALIRQGDDNVMASVDITAADVTFPEAGVIRVTTHRTAATGDNFLNYFLRIFADDGEIGEMTARAAAGFNWVCGGKCIKPWAPPDRWDDVDGDGLFTPDVDIYHPVTTGYTDADLGTEITLVSGNASGGGEHDFGQFWYYSIDFPPLNKPEFGTPQPGGSEYADWICDDCHDDRYTIEPGDIVQVEPGGMIGPNNQGLRCLIAKDPEAQWSNGQVINSAYPTSPRIIKAALFDPSVGLQEIYHGRKQLTITKIMVLFIEQRQGNAQITGRFMRLSEPDGTICEDQSHPTSLFKVILTE